MRLINFRAWDGIQRRMVPNVGIFPTGEPMFPMEYVTDTLTEAHIRKALGKELDEDKSILMQFTGLLDKNGIEIYEGDILKKAGIVTWNQDDVRWCCINIDWNDKREWHDMLYLTTPLEVIGNIYENPELSK